MDRPLPRLGRGLSAKPMITILSTADWAAPVWTNKQHLAARLSADTAVLYVESLGLRAPKVNANDLRRIAKRVGTRPQDRGAPPLPPGLQLMSPRVVPFHRSALVRAANRRLLHAQLQRWLPPADRQVLYTFSPLTYGLEALFDATVYHSVDFLHSFPGVPSEVLLSAERRLLARADVVAASSSTIKAHLERLGGHDVRLWENVADTGIWTAPPARDRTGGAVFVGTLSPAKLDFSLITAVADLGIPVDLVGPVDIDGQGSEGVEALLGHQGVRHLGQLSQPAAAQVAGNARVGLIPYRLNDYTAGVFPMKVYEYLAAGLSVVATPLPALQQSPALPAGVTLAEPLGFASAARSALSAPAFDPGELSAMASDHSWESRVRQVLAVLEGVGAARHAGPAD